MPRLWQEVFRFSEMVPTLRRGPCLIRRGIGFVDPLGGISFLGFFDLVEAMVPAERLSPRRWLLTWYMRLIVWVKVSNYPIDLTL